MKTSARGIDDIIFNEGSRLTAYKDSRGIWTIGVGHAATSGEAPIPHAGMVITAQEEQDTLARDLLKFEAFVNAQLPNVPQNVFDGAVSFAFNTGGRQKNGQPASWFATYRSGDLVAAEKSFMQWVIPPEIKSRREREADLIFRGKYHSDAVSVPPVIIGQSHEVPPVPVTPAPPAKTFWELVLNIILSIFKRK